MSKQKQMLTNFSFGVKKTLELCMKYLRESIRSKLFLIISLIFPAFFMLLMGMAFGGTITTLPTYNVYVLNEDTVSPTFTNISDYISTDYTNFGEVFTDFLKDSNYPQEDPNEEVQIFILDMITEINETIEQDMIEGNHILLITIQEDFSENLLTVNNDITLEVTGDQTVTDFQNALGILTGLFDTFCITYRELMGSENWETIINQESTLDVEGWTFFDFLVPGVIILAIVMNLTFVATTLTEESEFKTLERLQLTPMKSHHLVGGLLLTQIMIATLQIAVLFGFAALLGFNATGSYILASLIALFLSLSCSGIGFIIAAFVKKSSLAGGIGTLISVPFFILTGAFIPINTPNLFTISGNEFNLLEILPTRVAYNMMNRVLIYNQSYSNMTYEWIVLLILTAFYLTLGLILIDRLKLRRRGE